jgi:hypothetical protein
MSRSIKVSDVDAKNWNLKFKVLGNNPYKCVMAAFEIAGFERT